MPLFGKSRISRLAGQARAFLEAHWEPPCPSPVRFSLTAEPADVDEALKAELKRAVEETFVDRVNAHIRDGGLREPAVYRAAQLDRRLFSKIMSDRTYRPARDTAIALALGLRLSFPQAQELLSRAGYTLSHSVRRDVILEYFFRQQAYNLTDINLVLSELGEKPLGR